jgi:hypothetical protein
MAAEVESATSKGPSSKAAKFRDLVILVSHNSSAMHSLMLTRRSFSGQRKTSDMPANGGFLIRLIAS